MPNIHIFILIFLSFVFCMPSLSSADPVTINGLQFSAGNPRVSKGENGLPQLSVDFRLLNTTDTRKLDLQKEFSFVLTDEFGNRYQIRHQSVQESYQSLSAVSIYPKEAFARTLNFELPIEKAAKVALNIDGNPVGIAQPIVLDLPPIPKEEMHAGIKITSPEKDAVFDREALVHLIVVPSSAVVPDKIIIDALDHTFEDASPRINNIYDLNIAKDFPTGMTTVSVIAQWTLPSGEKVTASDTIALYIKERSSLERL